MQKETQCPRCSSSMKCKVDDIDNCNCASINLSPDTLSFLAKTNYKCLCNNCLKEINNLVLKANNLPLGNIEGIHYIIKNGLLVFTELYHIQRGYCCENDCLNCAYGYRLKK